MQLDFRRPTKDQVAKRLVEVCQHEGLTTNQAALMALAEMTNGDIRMALGHLQMVRLRSNRLTFDDLKKARKGHHAQRWPMAVSGMGHLRPAPRLCIPRVAWAWRRTRRCPPSRRPMSC